MNRKILNVLLGQKVELKHYVDGSYSQLVMKSNNSAVDDCIEALSKLDIGIVPSEEEIADLITNNLDWPNESGERDVAKLIRELMLGDDHSARKRHNLSEDDLNEIIRKVKES